MRIVTKHLRILAPLLAAAAFAAGCGGSSSDSTTAGDGYGAPAKAAATTAAKAPAAAKTAGTTVEMSNTTFQPQSIDVKVGDTVIYSKYGGTEVKWGGEEYLILSARDVLAIVEK